LSKLENMTATEIYEHPEYLNSNYLFKNEVFVPMNVEDCSKYSQSNFFRIRNNRTLRILKPIVRRSSKVYEIILYKDDGHTYRTTMHNLFKDFDVNKAECSRGTDLFINGAY